MAVTRPQSLPPNDPDKDRRGMTVTSPEAPRRPAPKPVDREKLQRRAVWLMFSFVVLTLAAVTVFRLSGAEPIAQPPTTAIAAERLVLLERPERNGPVFVRDAETGRLMARSDRNKNGFIDVIGRVVDRQRLVDGTDPQAVLDSESATAVAMQNTLLTPRFYTTDFDELDAIDVDPGARGLGQADRRDEGRPQQGPFQEERGLGPCRLGRDGPRAEEGIHRLPRQLLHRRVLRLRPLQGNEAARQQPDITSCSS
jgi:hypothetical protein